MVPDFWFLAGYSAAVIMLAAASYLDLRSREIDVLLWIPFAAAAAAIAILRGFSPEIAVYMAASMIAPAVLLALSLVGMMGLADPIAVLLLSLLLPRPSGDLLLPPSLVILLLSNLAMLLMLVIPLLVINMARIGHLRRLCSSWGSALAVAATALPMSLERFFRTRFHYPLVYPSLEGEEVVWRCRSSFDIDEDPADHRRALEEMARKGLVGAGTRIYTTWGVPYIVFILAGTLAYPLAGPAVEATLRILVLGM